MRIIRFELITLRLKGEYSTNWVIFPSFNRKMNFTINNPEAVASLKIQKSKNYFFVSLFNKIVILYRRIIELSLIYIIVFE